MFYDSPRHNPVDRTTRKTSGISFCLQQYFESLLKYTFIQVQALNHQINRFIQDFFYPENYSSVVRDKSDAKCSPQCNAWTLTLHLPPWKIFNSTSLLCRSLSISESQHCLGKARVRQLNAFSTGVIWTERAACNGGLYCTLSSVPFDQPDNNAMLAMNHQFVSFPLSERMSHCHMTICTREASFKGLWCGEILTSEQSFQNSSRLRFRCLLLLFGPDMIGNDTLCL